MANSYAPMVAAFSCCLPAFFVCRESYLRMYLTNISIVDSLYAWPPGPVGSRNGSRRPVS
eukprot:319701-Pleurochrysis_carterae.AAC.1